MGRNVWRNLGTLVLSLLLAGLVWVVAITEEDPIEEKTFTQTVPVNIINLPADLILTSPTQAETLITVRAPRSVLENLSSNQIHVSADVAGMSAGLRDVPLTWSADTLATEVTELNPASVRLTLETRIVRDLPIHLDLSGEPAAGYESSLANMSTATVTVTGPASIVNQVSEVLASVAIANLKRDFNSDVALRAVDATGTPLEVNLAPLSTRVLVPITQKLGFRDVAVRVLISGTVAPGYRITNITVAPPIITVSSADPNKVSDLPGYIDTLPVNVDGETDDISGLVVLNLPEGVTVLGNSRVQVQVNIAAIESTLTIRQPVDIAGLGAGLFAIVSPTTLTITLAGPLPVLDDLQLTDVRVVLDVATLAPGIYQLTPQIFITSSRLQIQSWLPEVVTVTISINNTPTATPTATPIPTPTPTLTLTPTLTPTRSP